MSSAYASAFFFLLAALFFVVAVDFLFALGFLVFSSATIVGTSTGAGSLMGISTIAGVAASTGTWTSITGGVTTAIGLTLIRWISMHDMRLRSPVAIVNSSVPSVIDFVARFSTSRFTISA